jgi:hypothetical protein
MPSIQILVLVIHTFVDEVPGPPSLGKRYVFNTLNNTPLQQSQVTARGVFLVDNLKDFNRLEQPNRFAITGGTGPYNTAHGQITEGVPPDDQRLLDIEL